MSRKGNCWDNAVAESFFKTLKVECLYRQNFETRAQTELAVFEYFETWYNTPEATFGHRVYGSTGI